MGGFAWVTLATNDSYSLGALVLAHSLKQVGSPHQLAVLLTAGVTKSMREKLSSVFDVVQEVNILDSKDETNLRLLKRPELGITFTKLHCWRLTQFDKCVFLDADTLVLKNCDELFEREELSAAPDVGWPDCFNSGVFVYRPSNETYEKLVQFALEKGSFDGGDQGLLNLYFSDWATKDITKHLPFIYNLCSTACYSYLPAFKQFGADTKIIHFIGTSKPWLQYFNTETRKVQPSSDLKHLEGILQHWWNIFCSLVHSQLAPEMSGLAGAFAKLTLGAPRTAEQNALDDHLRRQGWEVGNIDYMGRDSFDNIWSKICQTISSDVSPTSKATEATTPSSTSEPQAEESVPKEALPSPAAATLEDSTPKTSEIIKPQSDHAQSIPSEQPKPVSEVESAVQASEKPQDIKPATLVVSESEIPAVPAAQTEPPQCPIPSKSGQGNASVENIQSPVPPKTEVDPEQPSELPPVVSTTTSEAVPAAALPADSSAALKDAASTTEVSVSAAAPTATASTVAVLTCVIPPKEAQPSTDAAQVESVQVSQEAPQILPTPVEDTKTAPAQVTSLTPAEGPKPLETTPVEVKPSQSPVALPPEQPSTQEVVKPAEAAPAISAPPAELPSPPEQTPTPEISKSIETPPVTSAPPIPEHIPVQEIPKSTEVAPAVPASQVELPSQPVQPPVQEVAKIGTPDTTAPISPAQEVSKTPEPLPAKVEVASPPEAVPLQETAKATTEIAPVIQAETVPATVSSAAEEAASAAPLAEGAAPATSKAKPAVKTKGESAGAGAQPTPPPRKAAGGGKKSKSKK